MPGGDIDEENAPEQIELDRDERLVARDAAIGDHLVLLNGAASSLPASSPRAAAG